MAWRRRALMEGFGLELSGQTIGPDLPNSEREAVLAAVVEAGVAVVPGQSLTDQGLHDFAGALGHVLPLPSAVFGTTGVTALSNLNEDGAILPPGDRYYAMTDANELWHTDSTFMRPRATISMLFAREIPPVGGETEFCDTRRLYELLTPEERARFEPLVATHAFEHSRTLAGVTDMTDEERRRFPPVDRPFVHLHGESGRKALCLASHIAHLSGLPDEETRALVAELTARATAPGLVYTHRWSVGDLVLWDNRCTMHRGRPYDKRNHRRNMRTVRLSDVLELA